MGRGGTGQNSERREVPGPARKCHLRPVCSEKSPVRLASSKCRMDGEPEDQPGGRRPGLGEQRGVTEVGPGGGEPGPDPRPALNSEGPNLETAFTDMGSRRGRSAGRNRVGWGHPESKGCAEYWRQGGRLPASSPCGLRQSTDPLRDSGAWPVKAPGVWRQLCPLLPPPRTRTTLPTSGDLRCWLLRAVPPGSPPQGLPAPGWAVLQALAAQVPRPCSGHLQSRPGREEGRELWGSSYRTLAKSAFEAESSSSTQWRG